MPTESENRGIADVSVSLCDVISSSGKRLTEIFENPWNNITFTESMGLLPNDSQFISGEIFLKDQVNIFNEMSLVGDEVVELKFRTPSKKEIDFVGRVYAIEYSRPSPGNAGIGLKFCSPEKTTADQLKLNRSYREVLYSEMIKDLFIPLNPVSDKTIYVEPTKNLGSMIVNNQSPVDAINKISQVSRSSRYNGANYVFYESSDKVFRCVSLESLVDPGTNESVLTYTTEKTTGEKNDIKKVASLLSFEVVRLPNIIQSINSGMYGSTVVSNNLMKRKVNYNTFNYSESYSDYKSVNFNEVSSGGQGKTMLTNNDKFRTSSFVHFIPTNYKSFDTEVNYNDERTNTALIRRSQMQQINAIQVKAIVSGDSSRKVGQIVELKIPSISGESGQTDAILSGRYLVSKVKHVISSSQKSGYVTVMMLVKDSFGSPLPERAA
tara:strand:- start:364 stop:1674 length:1311 start_codon:yes stop_codon:yes gene_type:complete